MDIITFIKLSISKYREHLKISNSRDDFFCNIEKLIPSDDVINHILELTNYMDSTLIHSNCPRIWVELENNILGF